MNFLEKESDEHSLNMTPLIDVVFLLLIFFLTATTFQKDEVEMELELPTSASGKPTEQQETIVISVASNGALAFDGRPVSVEALKQKLKAAASRQKNPDVHIRGDRRTQFGLVAEVLDACLVAKLTSISIIADPDTGDGAGPGSGR